MRTATCLFVVGALCGGACSKHNGPDGLGTEGNGHLTIGPEYAKNVDLTDRGAPRGRRFEFAMESTNSKIFRGEDKTLKPEHQHPFTRKIFVYVPAQYRDGTPAPILVIHDGPRQLDLVSFALDNLTISKDAKRRLPPFIAIAVANGGSDSKGSERGLEYDTISDRLARFINDEVLAAVLNNPEIKAAYPGLSFTSDPWGRAVLGCSSGGAAAMTMGWTRPDLFRRIAAYSATLVDQQDDDAPEEAAHPLGAWEYHSGKKLVENSEKKPLRIFTHVSEQDLRFKDAEETYHNWVMANQRMADALKGKGYNYRFLFSRTSRHCDRRVFDHSLADTLVWLWQGYRARVTDLDPLRREKRRVDGIPTRVQSVSLSVPVPPSATACPSEDQLLAHAQGTASKQELDELLRHLDGCVTCRYLLAESSRALPPGATAVASNAFEVGDSILDRYRIERFLARNARGEVYLARDLLLVESVALKTLAGVELDDPQAAFRFRAGARLARKVVHPNVCRILELGLHVRRRPAGRSESIPFLTMEFLTGETVASRVASRGPIPEAEAAPIILQTVAGLHAIHGCGIVHGDFRSENVFLVRHSRGERALVMDFGLTHPLDSGLISSGSHEPMLAGAIDTMAPEQIEGRPSEPTVDVFAFGVFLFEVLTGRRPFINVPVFSRLSRRAPSPSSIASGLAPGWDPLVARCLELDPRARFPNLSELAGALGALLRPNRAGG